MEFMYSPSQQEFLKSAEKGNVIPVYKEILGDLETPVSAYFKIASRSKYSFLLESVEGEEKIAQFSFLAKDPELVMQTQNNAVKISRFRKGGPAEELYTVKDSPLTFIRDILKQYRFVKTPKLPRFCGGLVGYLSYDVVKYFERLPSKTKNDLKLPDLTLVLCKSLLIFDHRNHNIKVVHCAEIIPNSSRAQKIQKYREALKRIDQIIKELNGPLKIKTHAKPAQKVSRTKLQIKSNTTEAQFCQRVAEAKKQIRMCAWTRSAF